VPRIRLHESTSGYSPPECVVGIGFLPVYDDVVVQRSNP
jgi:hypothetical protein